MSQVKSVSQPAGVTMQGPLRNELLILFLAEEQRGEIRHVMELLRRRGFVESQPEVQRYLDALIAEDLVEAPRGALTDARIYQATPAALRALHAHRQRRAVEEHEDEDASRATERRAATDPGDLGGYEAVELSEADLQDEGSPSEGDERSLQELAREVLSTQGTNDLCAVAWAFARAMQDLRGAVLDFNDTWERHPIARLWADRISHLTGTQLEDLQPGDWLSIRAKVQRLAEGAS